jgi:hypothetical protein
MVRILFLFFILLLTFSLEAQNQITSADKNENKYYRAIIDSQTDYLNKLYFQNVDNVDELVNGIDYVPYYYRSDSKPLLFNGTRYESSLILKGRRYSNLSLEYDTYLDEIVYSDNSKYIESKVFKVALNKDPVDGLLSISELTVWYSDILAVKGFRILIFLTDSMRLFMMENVSI